MPGKILLLDDPYLRENVQQYISTPLEYVETLDELENRVRSDKWDTIIVTYPFAGEAAKVAASKIPLIVVCEPHEEDDALLLENVNDVLLASQLKRLPFILRREHAARVNEEQYRSLIEDQTELICRYDADFRLTFVNRAYAENYGKRPEDILGKCFVDFIPPEQRDIALNPIRALNRSNPISMNEHLSIMPDNSLRWFQWTDHALFDEEDQLIGYQGVGRDITDRKLAEKELEALYNATSYLFKADSLLSLGQQITETVVREFEQADCALLLVDHKLNRLIPLARIGNGLAQPEIPLRLDDNGAVKEAVHTVSTVYAPVRSELVIPLKAARGVIAVLVLRRTEIDAFDERDRRILAAYAERAAAALENMQLYEELNQHAAELEWRVAQRTAEFNRAKERAEAILNNSTDGILLTDSDLRIQQTNQAFNNLFRCHFDDYFHKSLFTLLSVDVGDSLHHTIFDKQGSRIELRARRRDGTTFDAEFSFGLIKNGDMVCTVRDISERKKAEESLKRYAAEIEDLYNNAPVGYHSLDADGIFIQINDTELRWLGYTREEVVGVMKLTDILTPAGIERFRVNFPVFKKQGRVKDLEYDLIRKDGSVMTCLLNATAIYDEHGQYVMSRATFYDTTDLNIAEQTLRQKIDEEMEFQQHLKELHRITIALTGIDQLDDFYRLTVELGRHHLGFERIALFLYDAERGIAIGTFGTDENGATTDERHIQFVPSPSGIIMRAYNQIERFAYQELTPLSTGLEAAGYGMNAAAVLWNGTESLGWLVIDNGLTRKPISKVLLDVLSLYSSLIGSLLARKRAEVALRESEMRYRLLANNITDLVIRLDTDATYTYVSPSSRNVLGYEPEEMVGKSGFVFIDPDDLPLAQQTVLKALGQRAPIEPLPVRFRHKDGYPVWLEVSGQTVFSETTGEPLEFVTSSRDITERKRAEDSLRESEEKFRMLVEAAPIAIVITDEYGKIMLVNLQAETLFGYPRAALIGQRVEVLLPENVRHQHVGHRMEYATNPHMRQMGEGMDLYAQRNDGHLFPVEIELSAIQTESGLMVMTFILDITERKERERQIRQALEKEKELGELKTRFVSMASHEFRTPLATIMALTETLSAYRRKLSDDEIDQKFTKIKEQVEHLKGIMEDVLQLARMQARRVEFNPVMLDLDALCQSVMDEFQNRFAATHHLVYRCDDSLRSVVLDKKLMRQIMSNLISNAFKYSHEGTIVTIDLKEESGEFILTVQDQGRGIPEADMKHLFEPFHRATNVGTISGTGLGLVITKEAVELHGGNIEVESEIGIGTTFTVRIPIKIEGT